MPELPEVETLTRGVREELLSKRFTNVEFLRPDIREIIPVQRLKEILVDQTISDVTRRGKYMLIHTSAGVMGVHLGMSGRFVSADVNDPLAPHTHAIFHAGHHKQFRFIDPRRFGRLFSIETGGVESHPFLVKLGVEPLIGSPLSLGRHLFAQSRRRSQAVKVFLMDSEIVVGVGNIYASETLWRAKISPHQSAKDLTLAQFNKIARQIIDVLSDAIKAGGTTFRDYRDSDGNKGYFQTNLAVYGRDQKPCGRCGTSIVKTTQAGRSTYHCTICQK